MVCQTNFENLILHVSQLLTINKTKQNRFKAIKHKTVLQVFAKFCIPNDARKTVLKTFVVSSTDHARPQFSPVTQYFLDKIRELKQFINTEKCTATLGNKTFY